MLWATCSHWPGDHSSALLRQFEHLQRWFVGAGLLRGDHVVEGHFEAAGCGGEKVVVHVGNDRELVARLEFARGRRRCPERAASWAASPAGNVSRHSVGVNPRRSPKPAHDRLQNFAIGTEVALLGLRFQFRVKTQEFGVGDGLAVARRESGAARRIFPSPSR